MPAESLSTFVPDCSKAEEQINWLNSLRTTREEQFGAQLQVKAFGPFAKDYIGRQDTAKGLNNWWINTNIREVYKKCAVSF
jgi:hypothetical protein